MTDVMLHGFDTIADSNGARWGGVFFGGNTNPVTGYDMGFDTEQEAKDKFLNDLLSFLSVHSNIVMYWRRHPQLVCHHDFDSEIAKYKFTGRICYTSMENMK